MSEIIIFSQSLQNDEKDDLWYKDHYYKGIPLTVSWSEISVPIREMHSYQPLRIDKRTQSRYRAFFKSYYFIIPCIEKDNAARTSLLQIVCPKEDENNLEKALEEFLQASNRHLSAEVWALIKRVLKTPFPHRAFRAIKKF